MQSEKKIIEADSFRVQIKQDKISLQFGKSMPNDDPDSTELRVKLLQTVQIDPAETLGIIMELVSCGVTYEKQYNKDIGFSTFWKKGGDE